MSSYTLYDLGNFPYDRFRRYPFSTASKRKDERRRYCPVVCAFDIETTRLPEIEQSIMYTWQVCIDNAAVYGRTWQEYKDFINLLTDGLPEDHYFIFFVHNLSYEFQFLAGIFPFGPEDVFYVQSRKVLRCSTGHIEYRCSYLQTNMSLDAFTHRMGVEMAKVHGFDYSKIRFPWTPLNDDEVRYILADVVGLVQAMYKRMELTHDDLTTLPFTSTGYVRRDLRKSMGSFNKQWLMDIQPNEHIFTMLREAFRGGNTHANRYYVGQVLENVHSIDRSSSYPDCQCNDYFPMGKWIEERKDCDIDYVLKLCKTQKRCILARVAFTGLHLIDPRNGCPYLSRDKCRAIYVHDLQRRDYMYDNGRILYADYLETTITEIDLKIILDQYTFDDIRFLDIAHCTARPLPREWVAMNIEYYKRKTELKDIEGQELYYMMAKALLNAIYGDTVQDPAKQQIKFIDGEEVPEEKPLSDLLQESRRNIYKTYAWGVWTTAHARYRLHEMIVKAQHAVDPETGEVFDGFVYTDTDSVKYLGIIPDVEQYNQVRKKASIRSGAYATDKHGVTHYMGVYEDEGTYDLFKTLGAKKYCYVVGGKLHSTIAGVSKKLGPVEMNNDINNFHTGFVFHDAAGLESVYNDKDYGPYEIDGHQINITRNVVLRPSRYEIGLAGDYWRILHNPLIYEAVFDESIYKRV